MSRRTEQMSSVLRRSVQSVLNEGLSDPRLSGLMVTVTSVKVTDDMRTAVISVSVIPENKQKLAWHALRDAARHIRRRAGDLVAARRLPEFVFKLDTSLKKQAAVLEAIARANEESGATNEPADEPTDTTTDDHAAPEGETPT